MTLFIGTVFEGSMPSIVKRSPSGMRLLVTAPIGCPRKSGTVTCCDCVIGAIVGCSSAATIGGGSGAVVGVGKGVGDGTGVTVATAVGSGVGDGDGVSAGSSSMTPVITGWVGTMTVGEFETPDGTRLRKPNQSSAAK